MSIGLLSGLIGTLMGATVVQNPPAVKHYEIIERNSNFVIAKINPQAYTANVFIKTHNKNADFMINTSYFWKNQPIGWLKDMEEIPSILKYETIRPIVGVDLANKYTIQVAQKVDIFNYMVVFQAGPTLIDDRKIVFQSAFKNEKFNYDIARVTKHTAFGITDSGKIVLLFANKASLSQVANKLLSIGVVDAINLDGGSSSSLKIFNKIYGNPKPFVGLQFVSVH